MLIFSIIIIWTVLRCVEDGGILHPYLYFYFQSSHTAFHINIHQSGHRYTGSGTGEGHLTEQRRDSSPHPHLVLRGAAGESAPNHSATRPPLIFSRCKLARKAHSVDGCNKWSLTSASSGRTYLLAPIPRGVKTSTFAVCH